MKRWTGSRAAQVALAGGVVAADQATKALTDGRSCGAVICPQRNEQLMLGVPGGAPWMLVIATIAGVAIWVAATRVLRRRADVPAGAGALIAGGAVANLIDRATLGSVRDFLAGPFGTLVNVADLAVIAGVVCLLRIAVPATAPAREEVNS